MFEGYDFVDFGCSTGANIHAIRKILPKLRGLGIDIDGQKIEKALANGHDAIFFDILKIPDAARVSFVTMSHFMEHLDTVALSELMLLKSFAIARDFVHVRQPFFDADGYLLANGLKLYWSDWRGHRNAATSLDFHKILARAKGKGLIHAYGIYGNGPILGADSPRVIPLGAPVDSSKYDAELHGVKRDLSFTVPVFNEIFLDIVKQPGDSSSNRARLLDAMNGPRQMTVLYLSDDYKI
ncbi:hypothetical protein CP98_00729 [Sphingobium yanoikuyae]|uniref:Class I SAM-dependent methyltransferase n=1 Tax=Sphingobium yanoikuyae TaxID=13690 RepID=A0A084ETI5_SPHYA|nr:class I SAM-dependent methyltransferase [Sphingobium yanoikuyae]KEZ21277.1 hypothetical protein CP98_00729 [Sphingobium yanoikuyae]